MCRFESKCWKIEAYVNACHKKLKVFLVLKVRKPVLVNFLNVKNVDRSLALSFLQSLLSNSSFAIFIDDYITDIKLVLSIKVSRPAILLKL